MVSECTVGKGPFGIVPHPGPIVSYSWQTFILPVWLVDQIRETALDELRPIERAYLSDILANATPNRMSMDDDTFLVELMREAANPIPPSIQIAGREYRR